VALVDRDFDSGDRGSSSAEQSRADDATGRNDAARRATVPIGAPCPITHFEVFGADPGALAVFYRDLLGWNAEKAPGVDYWRIASQPGDRPIGGGVTFYPEGAPRGWLCYMRVASIDDSIARALSLGGRIVRSKTAAPKTAWYAMIADPDGNVFCIWQPDPNALPPPEAD
jgi:uncharacterized protein